MMDTKPDTPGIDALSLTPATGPSVGATLRAAREEQGMKIVDVADRIKFSVRQIEALEADDLSHLPQGAFLRGFIRSYARALHLDESALLTVMPVKSEAPLNVGDSQSGGDAFPSIESSRQKSIYLLAGALAVALVLVAFVWSHNGTPKPESTVIEDVKLPELTVASAPVLAMSEAASAVQPAVAPAIPVAPVVAAEPKKITPPAPTKAVEPAKAAAPVAASTATAQSALALEQLKKRPIHIVFVEETWMEVVDVNGELLLSLTASAGSEKWIGGRNRAPYQVTIGKAGAVRIYDHGREVDLSQYNQTGLVKLVLE
ncbi:MAG: DUF4115 domain-containing protein [Sideroxydans sp.]|nr:DUF4115 domain-containing protein [Sideroxydans sp.]